MTEKTEKPARNTAGEMEVQGQFTSNANWPQPQKLIRLHGNQQPLEPRNKAA